MTATILPFEGFGKIARLSRDCVITEKLDGTNAQILVPEDGSLPLQAGSRTRYITPESDNYGFARWVKEHEEELRGLGPGRHFGEWWGQGIQRGYGILGKRFSLFNTGRWASDADVTEKCTLPPACCHVVPVLYSGPFSTAAVDNTLDGLLTFGSVAATGFMKPEGIMVYHVAAGVMFKKTIEKDEAPKGKVAA